MFVKPTIHIVVLTWNQKDDTLACLASLAGLTYPRVKIVLVDNGSTDGTRVAVKEQFPHVEALANSSNLGFAAGYNAGLRHVMDSGAELVFLLNNDTVVAPDVLDRLAVPLLLHEDSGMASPKVYQANARDRIWSTGADQHWLTLEMTNRGDGQLDRGQWNQILDRDYLVACALLIKRRLLEDIGLFDECFSPIYYEDLDFCVRARRAGYRLLMVPSAMIWHKGAASGGGKESARYRYLMARNSVLFFRKHVRGWRWAIVAPYRVGSALKTSLLLAVRRQWAPLLAHWQGIVSGLGSRPLKTGSRMR